MDFGIDNLKMRDYIFSLIRFKGVEKALDIGCKDGMDLRKLSTLASNNTKFFGIDINERFINRAIEHSTIFNNIEYLVTDTSRHIPFDDHTFDLVYSLNLLECIEDKGVFLDEVCRVLNNEGQVVFGHFDWDSVIINGIDKELIRNVVTAYADNQQEWMGSVDSWMGRRLLGEFNKTGKFRGDIYTYTITNSDFKKGNYGYGMIHDFKNLVGDRLITEEEYTRFYDEMIASHQRGDYFFSINMYIYVGTKA